MKIMNANTHEEWTEIYKELVFWELELEKSTDSNIIDILQTQKEEANIGFSKFIIKNYQNWITGKDTDKPLMSHTILKDDF